MSANAIPSGFYSRLCLERLLCCFFWYSAGWNGNPPPAPRAFKTNLTLYVHTSVQRRNGLFHICCDNDYFIQSVSFICSPVTVSPYEAFFSCQTGSCNGDRGSQHWQSHLHLNKDRQWLCHSPLGKFPYLIKASTMFFFLTIHLIWNHHEANVVWLLFAFQNMQWAMNEKRKSTKISFWCLLRLISGIFGATHGLIHIRCTKKENHTGLKMRLKMCNFLCLLQQTAWIMKCFFFFQVCVFLLSIPAPESCLFSCFKTLAWRLEKNTRHLLRPLQITQWWEKGQDKEVGQGRSSGVLIGSTILMSVRERTTESGWEVK